MSNDLTDQQREFARWIVAELKNGLTDTFFIAWPERLFREVDSAVIVSISGIEKRHRVDRGTVEVLGAESLLRVVEISALEFPKALLFAHARIALSVHCYR
jgi:hypothetical protein